ncbi:hypothetical protein P3W85_18555 [Cupriavidus basilensis]|uniref:LacI family transcriptional regulator n=1 Tax=Cupriavidus basilensis TaxID=68895 RepID=A0ABT6AQP7_9BURK|nr:hypothetical protein [Cupriavidus basilensis]MDF3834945.1 hypothetical protein [Cupriavidus basilensis]
MLDDLLSFGVHGVITVPPLTGEPQFAALARQGLAMASYDGGAGPDVPARIDHAAPDSFQAGHLAASRLAGLGHRRIAFVMPTGRTVSRSNKIAGFMAAAMVRRVMPRLSQPALAPLRLCFPGGLVVRQSSAPPPAANRLAGAVRA